MKPIYGRHHVNIVFKVMFHFVDWISPTFRFSRRMIGAAYHLKIIFLVIEIQSYYDIIGFEKSENDDDWFPGLFPEEKNNFDS